MAKLFGIEHNVQICQEKFKNALLFDTIEGPSFISIKPISHSL